MMMFNTQGIPFWMLAQITEEDQAKARKYSLDMITTLEEHSLGSRTFFGGEKFRITDLAIGS